MKLILLLISLTLYPTTMVVTEIDDTNDLVILEDFNGNEWSFYGAEDWQVDDIASVIMSTNGTADIYDDKIMIARYSGYIN